MKIVKDSVINHLNTAISELKKEKRDDNKIRQELKAALLLVTKL